MQAKIALLISAVILTPAHREFPHAQQKCPKIGVPHLVLDLTHSDQILHFSGIPNYYSTWASCYSCTYSKVVSFATGSEYISIKLMGF